MELLKILFVSSRPISWVNTAFPFAAAYLLAGGGINTGLILGTLFFLIPYNVAMYGINDVFDYESDIRNPRKGGVEGAVLARHWHRPVLCASFISCAPFLLALTLMGSLASGFWLWLAAFMVVAYSAKGLRFKEIPVLDSLTSSAHFTLPAVFGAVFAAGSVPSGFGIAFSAFFLWGTASHALGAVQDITADRQAGLSSIGTKLGARAVIRGCVVVYALAAGLLFLLPSPAWLTGLFGLGYALNAARYWNVDDATCERTRGAWGVFLWLNYLVGAVVTISLATVFL